MPGADLARTIGWFTTLFPVRLDLSGGGPRRRVRRGPVRGGRAQDREGATPRRSRPRHRFRTTPVPERRDGAGSFAAGDAPGQLQLSRQNGPDRHGDRRGVGAGRGTRTAREVGGARRGRRRRQRDDRRLGRRPPAELHVDLPSGRPHPRGGSRNSRSCGCRRSLLSARMRSRVAAGSRRRISISSSFDRMRSRTSNTSVRT